MKRLLKFLMPAIVGTSMAMSTLILNSFAATDPNGDGVLDITDVVFISAYLQGGYDVSNPSSLDFNGDGIINSIDSLAVQRYLAGMPY